MTDQADRVLDMIDGALADYTSPDAMRWSPDPENAEPPVDLPRQDLPEIGAIRGGIRYPVSDADPATVTGIGEVRVTPLDEHGRPTGDSTTITDVDVRLNDDLPPNGWNRPVASYAELADLEPCPNIMDAMRRAADEYRDRYRLNDGVPPYTTRRRGPFRNLAECEADIAADPPLTPEHLAMFAEEPFDYYVIIVDAVAPTGDVLGRVSLALGLAHLDYPELLEHTWCMAERELWERTRHGYYD